jgi:16S rRNA (cytidine1402-2'-O)-methyltransferase
LNQAVDLGADTRPFVVARELTKMHEEFLRGTAADILAELSSRPSVKGEFVVIVDSL